MKVISWAAEPNAFRCTLDLFGLRRSIGIFSPTYLDRRTFKGSSQQKQFQEENETEDDQQQRREVAHGGQIWLKGRVGWWRWWSRHSEAFDGARKVRTSGIAHI